MILLVSLNWLNDTFTANKNFEQENVRVKIRKRSLYSGINITKFNALENLENNSLWEISTKRNIDSKSKFYLPAFTDFMIPFPAARSTAAKAKNKIIPYANFVEGRCILSNEIIALPETKIIKEQNKDSDGDGIPDRIEKIYNLNPHNPSDARYDLDKDGFSNLVEYKYDPLGINSKKHHPPFIMRTTLINVKRIKLPIILKQIIKHDDNKYTWDVQLKLKNPKKRWNTYFLKIGDKIPLKKYNLTIKDIIYKQIKARDKQLGVDVKRNVSTIILVNEKDDEITARLNSIIYKLKRIILLKDVYSGKKFTLSIGDTLTLGNAKEGYEKYIAVEVDRKSKSLKLKKDNEIFIIFLEKNKTNLNKQLLYQKKE